MYGDVAPKSRKYIHSGILRKSIRDSIHLRERIYDLMCEKQICLHEK